jgi:serine/threonine protein kinase
MRLKPRAFEAVRTALWLRSHGAAFRQLLAERFALEDARLAHVWDWHHGIRYAHARTRDGSEVFVKSGGPEGTIEREVALLRRVVERTPAVAENVPHIVDAEVSGPYPTVVLGRLYGATLQSRLDHDEILDAATIVLQFERLADALADAGVIHRDVRPDNLFLVPAERGFRVVLIDFAFGVTPREPGPHETKGVYRHPELLPRLGLGLNPEPFMWDDAHSFVEIARRLAPDYDGPLRNRVGGLVYRAAHDLRPA